MSIYKKADVVRELIATAPIKILVDPRHSGVVVPEQHKGDLPITLDIGHGMAVSIPDLDIGEEGIGATLSFNRKPEWCFIPWAALIGLAQGDVMQIVWHCEPPEEARPAKRPSLSVVE